MIRGRGAALKELRGQTRSEQAAFRNALALFFGALLGANLGELEGVDLKTYIALISVLAGAVMAFQLIGQARSRLYGVLTLVGFGALLAYAWTSGLFIRLPQGTSDRIFATLAVWLVATMMVEMTPVIPDRPKDEKGPAQ